MYQNAKRALSACLAFIFCSLGSLFCGVLVALFLFYLYLHMLWRYGAARIHKYLSRIDRLFKKA